MDIVDILTYIVGGIIALIFTIAAILGIIGIIKDREKIPGYFMILGEAIVEILNLAIIAVTFIAKNIYGLFSGIFNCIFHRQRD